MLDAMLNKMDRANGMDVYQICTALVRGEDAIDMSLLQSDWYYALYLRLVSSFDQLDLP